jgi:beta-1,4-mannosyl-glycoprotein beta-1,4-N-acetylglucosaminyltransferase
MFFDETMLAEIRLNILNNYVDKFIITESKYAHNGDNKKLNFDINLFSDFKKKIEYIVIDEQPPNILENNINDSHEEKEEKKIINSLKRENFQRDMLSLGLKGINDNDLVIISDVDEIPNLEKINFQENDNTIFIFKQKMFYYKFNLYYENFEWFGSRAIKKKFFLTPQWLRNIKSKKYPLWRVDTYFSKKKYHNIKFIENGGWHFTCIKSPKDVHKKLTSYLHHQDFENSNI